MAATITQIAETPGRGSRRPALWFSPRQLNILPVKVNLDNSYATGGYDLSSIHNEFKEVVLVCVDSRAGYAFDYDYTGKKLKAYRQTAATGALAEVANAVDLSAVTNVGVLFIGYL